MRFVLNSYIVKGNLSATLESIRGANKQSIIRYYDNPHNSSKDTPSSTITSIKLYQPAANIQGWSRWQQRSSKDIDGRRRTKSYGSKCIEKSLPLTKKEAGGIQKTHELHSPSVRPSAGIEKADFAQSSGRIHESRIRLPSNINHESYSRFNFQHPYMLASNNALNDNRYAKYVYELRYKEIALMNKYIRLDDEIRLFCQNVTLGASQKSVRNDIIALVQRITAETVPGLKAKLFGSECVGLATQNSDIDFALWHLESEKEAGRRGPSPTRPTIHKFMLRRLKKLADALASHPDFARPLLIHARFPLAQATHCDSDINVQIIGKRHSITTQEYAKAFQSEFPELRLLYYTIKEFLRREGLANVYKGGLGSYPIFIMIVAFLKLRSTRKGLGYQLIEFLDFYSSFNTVRYALTITPPGIVTKKPAGYKYSKVDRQKMLKDIV